MSFNRASMCAVLLGLSGSGVAAAADTDAAPLRLALAPEAERVVRDVPSEAPGRTDRAAARRAASIGAPIPQESLGQRALQSMLASSEAAPMPVADQESATFKFRRQGNAGRDIKEGYKDMCDRVSRKLWNDPNGKRIKFDVAGKPGVAFEIPLR